MRQVNRQAALGREDADADGWREAMQEYWRDLLERGEFPRLAKMAGVDWELGDEDRFELGLGWILDGIAARHGR